jgi:hypothetical protein
MKKKIFIGVAFLAIAAIAAFNVNLNTNTNREQSLLSLANVEALAQESPGIGTPGKNYKYVTLFEISSTNECVGSTLYTITYYGSDCYFEGSIPCPGHQALVVKTGYCA